MPVRARFGPSREPEMRVLSTFVRPGDHCVDIGCHLGIYAHALLLTGGPGTTVTGIEPQPMLADYLESSFSPHIRRGQFRVLRTALGAESGTARLSLPIDRGKINRGRATLNQMPGQVEIMDVPVVPLDSLNLPRVSFIKCDVEGYELPVLLGGRSLLLRDMPSLLVEIEEQHAHHRAQATFDYLVGLGYVTMVLRDRDRQLASIAGTQDIPGRAARFADRYVYNYFFVAAAKLAQVPHLSA